MEAEELAKEYTREMVREQRVQPGLQLDIELWQWLLGLLRQVQQLLCASLHSI